VKTKVVRLRHSFAQWHAERIYLTSSRIWCASVSWHDNESSWKPRAAKKY